MDHQVLVKKEEKKFENSSFIKKNQKVLILTRI